MAFHDLVTLEMAVAGNDHAAILGRHKPEGIDPVLEPLRTKLELQTLANALPYNLDLITNGEFSFLRGHFFFFLPIALPL
jgi:hypothetical protein